MNPDIERSPASRDADWGASVAEWLAGLFMAPVSGATVASYRAGLGGGFLDAIGGEPGCEAGVLRMRSALLTEDAPDLVAARLGAAFTLLFDGVGGPATVSLYESAHVGGSGRLFGVPAGEMAALLRQFDVSTDAAFREPADHISVELALLARLLRTDAGDEAAAALLDEHLLGWVPQFSDQCCDADRSGFYAGAACVLTGFLAGQRKALHLRTGVMPGPSA